MPEVPLITRPMSSTIDTRTADDVQSTVGQVMGAAFTDAWKHSPIASINRYLKISNFAEETGGVTGINDLDKVSPAFVEENTERYNWYNREEALTAMQLAGLNMGDIPVSDFGANKNALDSMIEGKKEERARRKIINRGAEGRGGRMLLAGLAGTFIDPINIASSFLPSGQARLAVKLAALKPVVGGSRNIIKRALTRASFGAKEGFVGSVLVEPFSIYASSVDHLDYTMEESLSNIAFGTLLGGGMHSSLGFVADRIGGGAVHQTYDDLSPQMREEAGTSAIIAATMDRQIRTDQFIEMAQGPIKFGKKEKLVDALIKASNFEKDGVLPPRALRKEIEKLTGIKVDTQGLTLSEIMPLIYDSAELPPSLKLLVQKSASVEELLSTLSETRKVQAGVEKQMITDLKTLMGDDLSVKEVKAKVDEIHAQIEAHDADLGAYRGTESQRLQKYNDDFFSPKNLNSFDAERAVEIDRIKEQLDRKVPDNDSEIAENRSAVKDYEQDVLDAEAVIKDYEEAIDGPSSYRADTDAIDASVKEQTERLDSIADCNLKGNV